jgi:hypothetical protein
MQDSGIEMQSLALAARKIMYYWPQLMHLLPESLVTAGRAAIDTGRAARFYFKDVPTHL